MNALKKSTGQLKDKVYNYPTKYKEGFTTKEQLDLLSELNLNKDEYSEKLGIHTCQIINDEIITYHHDVLLAIKLTIEHRDVTVGEWD